MKHKQAAEKPANTDSQASRTPLKKGATPLRALVAREAEQSTHLAQGGSFSSQRGEQGMSSHLSTTMQQAQRHREATLLRSDLALLIGAENVSPQHASEIVCCAHSNGQVTIRRLDGNFATQQMAGWREAGWQHGLTPIHHQSPIAGKNTCDIALVVDAMQLCEEGIRRFVLAPSNSDSVPLVRRLRERGCVVIGMGRKETHLAFKQICTQFVELGRTIAPSALENDHISAGNDSSCRQSQPQDKTASLPPEHRLLCAYREATPQAAGEWISLSLFARCLREGMGEQEQVDPDGLAALLEKLAVLFSWKLGKGGQPLLREREHAKR